MSEGYCLGDLTFAPFHLSGAGTNDRCQIKVWSGTLCINITRDKENKNAFYKTLNSSLRQILLDSVETILKASPETSRPVVISSYNRETRQWVTDWIMELYKDSKMVYHLKISNKDFKYDFLFKGPSGVSIGNDPLSDAQKSEISMKDFRNFLVHHVPVQLAMSNKKKDPTQFQNRGASRSMNGTQGGSMNSDSPVEITDNYF